MHDVIEAHRLWQLELRRRPGQLGATIVGVTEGTPIFKDGQTATYDKSLIVAPGLVDFLKQRGTVTFKEI